VDTININQLQFRELSKSISDKVISDAPTLKEKEQLFLLKRVNEFLSGSKRIIITNRKQPSTDGYFILSLSSDELSLLKSKSVSRFQYQYSFSKNQFSLNGKVVDQSFLNQFILYFDHVANQLDTGQFEIIEE
jgi:hypothetical protein